MSKKISELEELTNFNSGTSSTSVFLPIYNDNNGGATQKLCIDNIKSWIQSVANQGSSGSYQNINGVRILSTEDNQNGSVLTPNLIDIRKGVQSDNFLNVVSTVNEEKSAMILLRKGNIDGDTLDGWNTKLNNSGDGTIILRNAINEEPYISLNHRTGDTICNTRVDPYHVKTDRLLLKVYTHTQAGTLTDAPNPNKTEEGSLIISKSSGSSSTYVIWVCNSSKWVRLCSGS